MKKILMMVLVSSLFGAAAMAKVGQTPEVNCKDILAKIKQQAKDRNASSSSSEEKKDDGRPANATSGQ